MSVSRIADTIYAFRFLRLLTTPWAKTNAYKLGILDKQGNLIRKPQTSKEKAVYNYFHRLVYNIKRLLNKIPLGKSTVASYITALFLLKESGAVSEETIREFLAEITGTTYDTVIYESCAPYVHNRGVLARDVLSLDTGETVARRGAAVCDIHEESNLLGIPIYAARVARTTEKIYITKFDLREN